MDLQTKLEALVEIVKQLDITVRFVPLGGEGGGLCAVKGDRVLFIDSSADIATQCDSCITEISQLAEINSIYIVPELREELEAARFREE